MSTNLLDLAKTAIGTDALGKIANSLGESEASTRSAFDIAGSAILGGLIKKVSDPQGAKDVYEEVSRFDGGALDNIIGMLRGAGSQDNASAISSLGSKLIASLLGTNQDSVIAMISRLTGIGEGSSRSLLTMLAPLFLGTIAKQVKSGGLSLGGLTDLIMGQKSQVAKNLPTDLTKQLGIANLLSEGGRAVHDGAERATRVATETAGAGSGLLKVLVPLVIVAAVGFLFWKMATSQTAKEVANKSVEVADSAVDETRNAIDDDAVEVRDATERVTLNKPAIDGFDMDAISKDLVANFGTLTQSISEINDEASARTALPQIEELTGKINQYGFDKMPQEATSTLPGMLQPLVEKLQAAIETAYKIPGVKEILQPAVDNLMNSVSAYVQEN